MPQHEYPPTGDNWKNKIHNKMAAYVAAFNLADKDKDQAARYIPNHAAAAWMADNIPLVDLPDQVMERVYYFRWWTYRKHIKSTPKGFVITEFLPDVPWAGRYNTISCAAGHHFYEGRWIRDPKYLNQYLDFWFGGGDIRSYTFWVADAVYKRYLVTGDMEPILRHYKAFVHNFTAWRDERGDETGLFWQIDDREGMEFSMAGTGLRPSVNSYMYAEARAIANIARLIGDDAQAEVFDKLDFDNEAKNIAALMKGLLWDNDAKFFKTYVSDRHRVIHQKKYQSGPYVNQPIDLSPVPELFGYAPWYYGVMDAAAAKDYEDAWRLLLDTEYFYGKAGLATAPISHPNFMYPHTHECAWDGPSWPYATCQALGGMARMLRNTESPHVSRRDFMALMAQYAAAHQLAGTNECYIDENYDPITGTWIARERLHRRNDANKDRGMYYNHSTFCDLVISDVIGLQINEAGKITVDPMAIDWPHFYLKGARAFGHEVDIMYDRDGTVYGCGAGLRILMDGQLVSLQGPLRG